MTQILGYRRKMIFKGDQEPALRVASDQISALSGDQVIMEQSPVGDSASNGDVENAVQQIQGMFRSMRSDMESRYGRVIAPDRPI